MFTLFVCIRLATRLLQYHTMNLYCTPQIVSDTENRHYMQSENYRVSHRAKIKTNNYYTTLLLNKTSEK